MARPAAPFVLTPSDHATLQGWLRMGSLEQRLGQRANILLLLADGFTPKDISHQLQVSAPVVFKWRKRYLEAGLEGLNDLPRSGQPRKLSTQKMKDILTLTTQRVPREATHWSVRLMARYAGVTTWQVRQVWDACDLKPHRLKTFKISNDPHFADKVVDVVGLYLNPPDNAIVLSVDEKTQIQALDRTQPMLPLRPGQIERRTHDYKRHGTASLYAAFDILTGQVIGRITQRHRAKEFLAFLRQISATLIPNAAFRRSVCWGNVCICWYSLPSLAAFVSSAFAKPTVERCAVMSRKDKYPDPEMIDDENPEWSDETFAKARPASEVLPEIFPPELARQMLKTFSL